MADSESREEITPKNGSGYSQGHARWIRNTIRIVVLIDLAAVLFASFRHLTELQIGFNVIYYFAAFVFLCEYAYRIITAAKAGRCRRYLFSFMGAVDLISIFPFLLPVFGADWGDIVELINFSKVFLVFKLARDSRAFSTLRDVLGSVRAQLQLVLAVSGSFMIFSSMLMYYVECNAQPEVFSSVGQGLWWAVMTMTTVGYGDIYPITPLGKILAGFIALIGMGMIALPAGIISAAFNRKGKEVSQSQAYCSHCGKQINPTADAEDDK